MDIRAGVQFKTFCKRVLFEAKRKLEIYHESDGTWELEAKGSPGNIEALEDLIFGDVDMTESQVILAVHVGRDGDGLVLVCLVIDFRSLDVVILI